MNQFLNHLKKLEKDLLKHWKAKRFNNDLFPVLAQELLDAYDMHLKFENIDSFLKFLICNLGHPDIHHYDLNQTENIHFTLLRNKYFFIDMYSWMDHTEIHAHNFLGAFQVLSGEFYQSTYQFKRKTEKKYMALGLLQLQGQNLLERGHVQRIIQGEGFIHQVFHPNGPSLSLCIRTPDLKAPYYSYFYPNLRLTDITFKRPEVLRIKAFNQYCKISRKINNAQALKLLAGLEKSRLIYEYMTGLNTFKVNSAQKKMLEEIIERFLSTSEIDLKKIKKQNQIHLTKLDLSIK